MQGLDIHLPPSRVHKPEGVLFFLFLAGRQAGWVTYLLTFKTNWIATWRIKKTTKVILKQEELNFLVCAGLLATTVSGGATLHLKSSHLEILFLILILESMRI